MFTKPCFLQWFLLFYFSFFRPLSSIFVTRSFGLLLLYPFRVRGVEICKIASSFSIAKHRVGQNGPSISSRRFAIFYFCFFTPPSCFSFCFFHCLTPLVYFLFFLSFYTSKCSPLCLAKKMLLSIIKPMVSSIVFFGRSATLFLNLIYSK